MTDPNHPPARAGTGVAGNLPLRAAFLFVNFFLIITAYYQIKPASRSLFIEYLGADLFPYVWIASALVLGVTIGFYHRWVARYPRDRVVLASCELVVALLVVFRVLMWLAPGKVVAVAFYVFVDIMSVVLVEQFWSLTNTLYRTEDGKRWYGLVGTGGLAGGAVGSEIATSLIRFTPLKTPDLLLTAAAFVLLIVILTRSMKRLGLYREQHVGPVNHASTGWRALRRSRYLMLIAAILLLAQLAQPVVEFQFMKAVEAAFSQQEARTAFLSLFFAVLNVVSIGVNLVITPLVQRSLGVIAGLMVQPLTLALAAGAYLARPMLMVASALKISDRGLSYSINRASKELLYIPINPVLIYQAKAWIDMFGYRIFKVLGSLLILMSTQWLPWKLSAPQLSWLVWGICASWIGLILLLRVDYRRVLAHRERVAAAVTGI